MPPNQLCKDKSIVAESHQSRAVRPYNLRSKSSTSNLEKGHSIDHDRHTFEDEKRDENGSESDDDFNDSNDIVPEQQHFGRTLNAALQDHDEVDEDEKVNMNNEDGFCKDTTALANQKTICIAPTRTAHEKWPKKLRKSFNEKIISNLNAFRDSEYTSKTASKRPINLVITDSLMSSIKFQEIYKNTLKLFVGFPNYPYDVIDQMKYQIEDKENDYVIKNILISIGFDALVYYPDFKEAKTHTAKFLDGIVNSIKKSFGKNGPKRYNQVKKRFDEKEELTPTPIQPPKIIIATIPEIANHPTAFNYNMEIVEMNEVIKKYVNDTKASAFKKHNIVLELYDWAKFSLELDQCNLEHLELRNRILTVDLAVQFSWLMIPSIAENPAALQQDYAEARARGEIMENDNFPQKNNNDRKKKVRFSEPLTSFVSDESSDFEMEGPQVHELNNPQFSTIQEDNSIAPRLRKRKASSNNSLSFEKKPKKSFLCRNTNNIITIDCESDNEQNGEIQNNYLQSISLLEPTEYKVRGYNDGKLRIFVFASDDKNCCYEFCKHPGTCNSYFCIGCPQKERRVGIYLNQKESEYIVFVKSDFQHSCTPRAYNPERFERTTILSSNFHFYYENNSLKAVIFDDEKKFCYKYISHSNSKYFTCCQCTTKKKSCSMKLFKNDDGIECFSHSNKNHDCEPLNYAEVIANKQLLSFNDLNAEFKKQLNPKVSDDQKLDPGLYEFEKNARGNTQLIVYASKEKIQCYKYYYRKKRDGYYCKSCEDLQKFVYAKHIKVSNGDGYVILGKTEHTCQPFSVQYSLFMKNKLQDCSITRTHIPEEKMLIHSSNFHFFYEKQKISAVIFDDEKTCSFKYRYHPEKKTFICYECFKKKSFVSIKLLKNDVGDEYFYFGTVNHVCEPLNYSEVIADKKLLSSSGLDIDKAIKMNVVHDVPKPDPRFYEIQMTDNGNPQLIVYTSKEKHQWYKYNYNSSKKIYVCYKCGYLKKTVSAKEIEENSSNINIAFGRNEHICQPFSVDTTSELPAVIDLL